MYSLSKFMSNKFVDISKSQNWNIADTFTKTKIARHLIEVDDLILMSIYGTTNITEEFMTTEEVIIRARHMAIDRFRTHLELLLQNTKFAVKAKDKLLFDEYLLFLKNIKSIIPGLKTVVRNQQKKTSRTELDEERFSQTLELLQKVNQNILEPLNKADLIFSSTEEFDPDEYMKQLEEDIVNRP